MAKKPEPDSLNGFLEAVEKEPSSRCICCKNPEVVKDLKAFAAGKADGSIAISIHKLWSGYIRPKYNIKALNSVIRHLRVCEGADL